MYKSFYKLKENPFSLTPDPEFLYLSSIHKRAMAYLQYALQENKGFSVITGEIGAGKTTIIKAILAQFRDQARIAHITNPSPNPHQLLRMIAQEYEIDRIPALPSPLEEEGRSEELSDVECPKSLSTADLIRTIHNCLLQYYAEGAKAVLIIDEAQRLSCQSLEEIRLLSNLETEKDKLIHIILAGQPELRDILASPQLKQLKQRVSLWFHILPLNLEETAEYIQHRMFKAGCPRNPFSRQAVKGIYRVSGGIPRIINIACDAALLAGYGEQKHKIKAWLVKKALDELDLKAEEGENNGKFTLFKRWKSRVDKAAAQAPRLPEQEELELLSQAVNSLYQKYRHRGEESGGMPKYSCFPDDLSSLQDQEFKDTIILSRIISLSQAIDALSKCMREN